jgi:hypothetical protein
MVVTCVGWNEKPRWKKTGAAGLVPAKSCGLTFMDSSIVANTVAEAMSVVETVPASQR